MKTISRVAVVGAMLASSYAFADRSDWYEGASLTFGVENHLEKGDNKIIKSAMTVNEKQLMKFPIAVGNQKETISMGDSNSASLIIGRQLSNGLSLEAEFGYTPRTEFVTSTYIGELVGPHVNYVEGDYTAGNVNLFAAYRRLISDNFYIRGRLGVGHSELSGELKSTTQNIPTTTTISTAQPDGTLTNVTSTVYSSKTTNLGDIKVKSKKTGVAAGLGIGFRATKNMNLEASYEATPLLDGARIALLLRF